MTHQHGDNQSRGNILFYSKQSIAYVLLVETFSRQIKAKKATESMEALRSSSYTEI